MHARIGVSTAAAGLVLGFQIAFALPAHADDAVILVADGNKVTLSDQDSGATASVTLENQGAKDVEVSVSPGRGAEDDCEIAPPDDATVKAHRQRKMTFTFSEACDPDRKEGTNFTITTGQGTATEATFDLHADPPTKPDPNWIVVGLIYVFAALISVVVLAVAWCRWKVPVTYPDERKLRMALPTLDADWKFADSWAANATVVTAVFTGIFGAKEVTTALLGDDATNLLAVALVSAAVALGLVGVSPMVLQTCRERFGPKTAKNGTAGEPLTQDMVEGLHVTPLALILAALFTLTGTVGQLATLLYALIETDFGADIAIFIIGILALALVFVYAYAATRQNLTTGATLPPPDKKPTEAETTLIRLPDRAAAAGRGFAPEEGQVVAVVMPQPVPHPTQAPQRRSAGIL